MQQADIKKISFVLAIATGLASNEFPRQENDFFAHC